MLFKTIINDMTEIKVSYDPPTGKPLGTNLTYKIGTKIVIPLLNLVAKRDWRGQEHIPKSGPAIVVNNHLSYLDVLFFAHFLFASGRAPRFLGKEGIFRVPILGKILLAAGQIPVKRESKEAGDALHHAVALLKAGHLVGVYPEGTLSRDENSWPMIAKTGIARLAIVSKAPVIPVAQWGSHFVMPTYEKKIKFWPRTTLHMWAGPALDMSPWYGKEDDPVALAEATAFVMRAITNLLEQIRGEKRPPLIFDPHTSDLPRTGNFKKGKKK